MSVVIDQVAGRVEPPPGPVAGPASGGQNAAAPQESQGKELPRQLRKLDRRRLRLQAD